MDINGRIVRIRTELFGTRGKAAFARKLGISPTTYQSYEQSRMPPADLLVRIADIAAIDLRWLLTGQASQSNTNSADNPVLQRAAALLARHNSAAAALAAFMDILDQRLTFPDKTQAIETGPSGPPAEKAPLASSAGYQTDNWIPILGRSAAGVPYFWAEQGGRPDGITSLQQLISDHSEKVQRRVRSAKAQTDQSDSPDTVQVITLTTPEAGHSAEFIAAAGMKHAHDDAFALRIDGDSMSPQFCHGDLVILSPSAPAVSSQAAVVQLDGQIGVTCKIYRCEGNEVHLVPINELHPPQTFPKSKVSWALRVLARVRA